MKNKNLNTELAEAIKGLLKIAKIAMPDTYFASDSRVKKANRALERYKCEEKVYDKEVK